jgi:hypothetical protein
MFLASNAGWAGIVFILVTTGILRPPPTPFASGANVSKEVPAAGNRNDVKKTPANSAGQRTLPRGGRWRLRSPNLGEHSRISEG